MPTARTRLIRSEQPGRDLPAALSEDEIGITLIPFPPSLHVWIRSHLSASGALFVLRARAVGFVLAGSESEQIACHLSALWSSA